MLVALVRSSYAQLIWLNFDDKMQSARFCVSLVLTFSAHLLGVPEGDAQLEPERVLVIPALD